MSVEVGGRKAARFDGPPDEDVSVSALKVWLDGVRPPDSSAGVSRPERIGPLLAQVAAVWQANPDWRFGQLVDAVTARLPGPSFYASDEDWSAALDAHTRAGCDNSG